LQVSDRLQHAKEIQDRIEQLQSQLKTN